MPKIPAAPLSPGQRWVDALRGDIAARHLREGETYLTAAAAGRMLGCSRATAHRALQRLCEQGILVARPGSGTFIGPGARPGPAGPPPRSLHVLIPQGFHRTTMAPLTSLIKSLASDLGGVGVDFHTFPAGFEFSHLDAAVGEPHEAGRVAAVLALGCHWSVHRYLKDRGLTALVIGSMFPDRQFLSSMDRDVTQSANLLVDDLVEKGHRRFLLVAAASGLAGVDVFTDGVGRRLAFHGLPPGALHIRHCHGETSVTADRIREVLQNRQRPTAILTDEEELAGLAHAAARTAGLAVPKRVEIVFSGSLLRTGEPTPYPHTRSVLEPDELAEKVSRLLRDLPGTGGPEAHRIPVVLTR